MEGASSFVALNLYFQQRERVRHAMGFLLHDDRKNSGEEGYMAAGLGKTEVIALGSILGVFAFLVSLGVAAYCYSNGKDNID